MWIEISGISCSQLNFYFFNDNLNERKNLNIPNFLMVVVITRVVATLI